MTVLNDTNRGRVEKIEGLLILIANSAESNKASQEDLWELLSPAVDAIQRLLDPEAKPDSPATAGPSTKPDFADLTAGQRAAMILADNASLKELMVSLSARLDVHLAQLTKEG
jgi:hypothetical protein